MSDDGVPRPVADGDASQRYPSVHREVQIIYGQLAKGAQTMGEHVTRLNGHDRELQSLKADSQLAITTLTLRVAALEKERDALAARISGTVKAVEETKEEIMPRATPRRIFAWAAIAVAVVGSPVASFFITRASGDALAAERKIAELEHALVTGGFLAPRAAKP